MIPFEELCAALDAHRGKAPAAAPAEDLTPPPEENTGEIELGDVVTDE
jgi:hypothetical protein